MTTVTLKDAQARLEELIDHLPAGDEIIIMRDQKPVARLIGEPRPAAKPRELGTMRGSVLYMAPDFDAPLDDFKEYSERRPSCIKRRPNRDIRMQHEI